MILIKKENDQEKFAKTFQNPGENKEDPIIINYPEKFNKDKNIHKQILRIEDMIPIKTSKKGRNLIKKVINVPNLQFYELREFEETSDIIEYLDFWKKNLNNSNHLIKVYNVFKTNECGSKSTSNSFVCNEFCNNYNLESLLEFSGYISENILRNIANQILKGLEYYNKKTAENYGNLFPDQILISSNGSVKILPNMKKFSIKNESDLTKIDSKFFKIKARKESNIKFSTDLFNFGYLLMICGVGLTDIIDFKEYSCFHNELCCCLYHCVEKYELTLPTKLKMISFLKLFSDSFLNFLCLSLSYKDDISLSKIKFHPWLRTNSTNFTSTLTNISTNLSTVNLNRKNNERLNFSLKEVLMINNNEKHFLIKFEKFLESVSVILSKYQDFINVKNLFEKKETKEVLKELNIEGENILRLKSIFENILK